VTDRRPAAGRTVEAEVIAQRAPRVLGPKAPAGLQDRHDLVGERPQLVRKGRSHNREAVDRPGILGGDDVVGELLRGPDELRLARAPPQLAGQLPQGQTRMLAGGVIQALRAAGRQRTAVV
jgi:hypothetical protein